LDYAAEHGAQIINMSFAGPKDPLIERGIAATASPWHPDGGCGRQCRGEIAAALSGRQSERHCGERNRRAGKLFAASNRGNHIAIAAPGADIFLPAPDEKYQITSGTSFSAAYVSGVAALMLERNPALKPNDIRAILTKTARDLGAPAATISSARRGRRLCRGYRRRPPRRRFRLPLFQASLREKKRRRSTRLPITLP
jgi:hypothetical protein